MPNTACRSVRHAARGRSRQPAPAALLAAAALAAGCATESVAPRVDASTTPPAEIAAGLYATLAVQRVGGAGALDTLDARATLENRSSTPIQIVHGACALDLYGWAEGSAADPATPPLWRSDLRQPWEGTYRYGCIRIAYSTVIQPGRSYTHDGLRIRVPVLELLGDSLPDGVYDVAGIVRLAIEAAQGGDATERPLRTGAIAVPLAVARPPLETRRTFDLVTWHARPVTRTGGAIEAIVDGELTHAGGMLLELAADCPLRLHAYATREQRDAAPRGGPPVVSRPAACGDGTRRVSLSRGQVERLSMAVPVSELIASGGTGVRHFAVSVHTANGQAWLDAGSVMLGN